MNVLSLFDGMSCGQIALRELGIPVEHYFASEIDRHAIAQTQLNFPDTIQLGRVEGVSTKELPKIDLLIGGSPCQGFSFAGKQLNFNDPRSSLFFEYVRILNELRIVNPNIKFMLENVRMGKEYEEIISQYLGLAPVLINSSRVSAQNRLRLYWSNIRTEQIDLFGKIATAIPQPKDRKIFIRDILETEINEKYIIKRKITERMMCNYKDLDDKSNCLLATSYKGVESNGMTIVGDQQVQAGTLRTHKVDGGFRPIKSGKAGCLCARARQDGSGQGILKIDNTFRRLTPRECARLQTIPEWYKWNCSDTQQYKMLGNGWTVEVIKHIFSFLN